MVEYVTRDYLMTQEQMIREKLWLESWGTDPFTGKKKYYYIREDKEHMWGQTPYWGNWGNSIP